VAVTELTDTRVLIPRVRRALEGPDSVSGSAAVAAGGLLDDQVNALIADAIANIILYTGGLFGHTLEVEDRDDEYMAPIAWSVDPELSEAEGGVIVAQAALDYYFDFARGMKVSQRIADEGQEWEYSFSPQLLTEQLKFLIGERDRALELIGEENSGLETWTNFIAVRDAQTSAIIEPWLGGGVGGQSYDPRFGTPY
jgi:hypothetical protein